VSDRAQTTLTYTDDRGEVTVGHVVVESLDLPSDYTLEIVSRLFGKLFLAYVRSGGKTRLIVVLAREEVRPKERIALRRMTCFDQEIYLAHKIP